MPEQQDTHPFLWRGLDWSTHFFLDGVQCTNVSSVGWLLFASRSSRLMTQKLTKKDSKTLPVHLPAPPPPHSRKRRLQCFGAGQFFLQRLFAVQLGLLLCPRCHVAARHLCLRERTCSEFAQSFMRVKIVLVGWSEISPVLFTHGRTSTHLSLIHI